MAGSARVMPRQDLRFCRSADGVTIAYAVHGSGPPLLIDACWLSHLQYDWESPVWRHYLSELGKVATVYRFDERGHGLSDREVYDHSLEARIADVEAIVEHAGLERFAVLAMSQGGPVTVEYAVRHPERVSRLVFYGSHPGPGALDLPDDAEVDATLNQLIKVGWERPTPEFRRVFTFLMIPGATEEQMGWLDELQRRAVTADVAILAREQRGEADVSHLLGDIAAPTLVIHSLRDRMNSFDHARHLSTGIPGARLVPLDSGNHILLADEPAWPVFVAEVRDFLAGDRVAEAPTRRPLSQVLSSRELEVLGLAADGRDNEDIARTLSLSVRTVERHLQNVYDKLDLHGKSARTGAVTRLLAAR